MKRNIKKLVITAMLMAVGLVLPILTGQIKNIGNMLLPMHIPILLCGFVCGAPWGLAAGVILPIMRSLIFGMPVMYPSAVAMAVELGTYGAVSGLVFSHLRNKNLLGVYISLITAMVVGRAIWGCTMFALMGISGGEYTWAAFLSSSVLKAIPGIILQLVLVPIIVTALQKAGFLAEDSKSL